MVSTIGRLIAAQSGFVEYCSLSIVLLISTQQLRLGKLLRESRIMRE